MIIPVLKEMLMHLQLAPIQETPSTKRQHVDEIPNIVQHEPKRVRTEVNRSPIGKKRGSTKMRSRRTIRHETKNYYRWNSGHLITFHWLQYNASEHVDS